MEENPGVQFSFSGTMQAIRVATRARYSMKKRALFGCSLRTIWATTKKRRSVAAVASPAGRFGSCTLKIMAQPGANLRMSRQRPKKRNGLGMQPDQALVFK